VRVIGKLGLVMLLGVALLCPASQAQAATAPEPLARENDWRVDPVAGGYRVTLKLADPVPLRSALPLLAIDGKPAGVAKQSADRRTLTLVSQDPTVLGAKDVKLVWSTETPNTEKARGAVGPGTDADWLKAPRGPLLGVDPGAAGEYKVDTTEYDLGDQAIYLPDLMERSELRGKVYSPRGAVGMRPLVIFLHGRHEYCYGQQAGPDPIKPWPCPSGMKPLPSYRGYDAPATALASHGYQVVSISADAINAYDGSVYDAGAMARGELVLAHLDLWKRWSTIGGGPFGRKFIGKVNLRNVGLMGHSRGGEGVARAAVLNSQRGGKYGIRAVLPLAPTDFARFTVPGVAMSVLLPYCDGDVSDLQGQKFYDDTRYAVSGDRATRSTVLVMGANHNFFNTEWTPGQSVADSFDDWGGDENESPCGAKNAARLTAKEQQAVGAAYVTGFFRLQLGGEKSLLPLFDGSNSRALSAGRAVVRVVSQAPASQRRDLARFDRALPKGAVTGAATAQVCAGVEVPPSSAATFASTATRLNQTVPTCATSDDSSGLPHWVQAAFAQTAPTTAVTKLRWTGKSGVVRVNLAPRQRDVHEFSALTFRASPDPAAAARTDLTVRVVDGHGRAVAVPVSSLGDALVRLPGSNSSGLPKTLLRTVRIPIASLRKLDLRDIRAVELRTDRVASGSVFLSDLSFAESGVGRSAPVWLPSVSASSVKVTEGNSGTRNLDFWVTMSRPSAFPVTVYAETIGDLGSGDVLGQVHRSLVFAPGRTRINVKLPLKANTRDGYDLAFSLLLSVPHQAIVGDSFGDGLVLDDDPTPTLTVGNAVAVEGTKVLKFPVKLSAASDKWVGVSGQLHSGTAKLGTDFLSEVDDGQPPFELDAFGYPDPGQATGWITVNLVNDKVKEPTEKFTVKLGPVQDAVLTGPTTVTGTITDDD
jgi:hypothetical protein